MHMTMDMAFTHARAVHVRVAMFMCPSPRSEILSAEGWSRRLSGAARSPHMLMLLACVLWLLPPLDVLAPVPSLENLLPLTHGRKQAALDAAPQAAARAADTAPRRELQSGPVDSSSSPRPAPVALAAARRNGSRSPSAQPSS